MPRCWRSGRLSLGPTPAEFEQASRARIGPRRERRPSGTAGRIWCCARSGSATATRSPPRRSSFVAAPRGGARARPPGIRGHRSRDVELYPVDAPSLAATDRTAVLLPVHVLGYPAEIQGASGLDHPIVEDACEALGAVSADGARSAPAATRGVRPRREQAADDRRGWHGLSGRRSDEGVDRLDANQGARRTWGWLDHDRLGFNYRLSDIALCAGSGPALAPGRCSLIARGLPGGTAGLSGLTGSLAVSGRRRQPARVVRVRRPAAARRRP